MGERKTYPRGIYEGNLPKGVSDYALYRPNGDVIAVVEAKRTSIDPRLAQAQAEFYVTQLEKVQGFRPFAFMTNGNDIYFLDADNANKRLVSGFFSPSDLDVRFFPSFFVYLLQQINGSWEIISYDNI